MPEPLKYVLWWSGLGLALFFCFGSVIRARSNKWFYITAPAFGPALWLLVAIGAVIGTYNRLRTARIQREYFQALVEENTARLFEGTGRNDPCPCGSGKKYKACCWQKYSGK